MRERLVGWWGGEGDGEVRVGRRKEWWGGKGGGREVEGWGGR